MNAKVELDPSLFETEINGYIKKMECRKVVDGEENKAQAKLVVRVSDQNYMDKILGHVAPVSDLAKHKIPSREDWMDSLTDLVKGKPTFDKTYIDHQCKVRISNKIIAAFSDCQLTSFSFDIEHTILYFHILAHGAKPGSIEELYNVLDHGIRFEFKRGEHWIVQEEMDVDTTEEQEEIDTETAEKVERAKDKANKANTDKARGRKK